MDIPEIDICVAIPAPKSGSKIAGCLVSQPAHEERHDFARVSRDDLMYYLGEVLADDSIVLKNKHMRESSKIS
jgi:hypothetical protein